MRDHLEEMLIEWQLKLSGTSYDAPEYADRALIVEQLTQMAWAFPSPPVLSSPEDASR